MFKIGEFSRLSQVSVKTLRFYDELGLLRPIHVDDCTGYRYYTADQLPRLNRLLALKDLGFTLEQIAPALEEGVSPEQLRGMLRLKYAEIQQSMQVGQVLLARVETRLQQIEEEHTMSPYEVIVKKVAPQKVASIRATLPNYPAIGTLMSEVYDYLRQNGVRTAAPCAALWHDNDYREHDVDGEGCIPIAGNLKGNDRVKVHILPAVETMACVVHHGSYSRFQEAYAAILSWIEANGYTVAGPNREIYLESKGDGNQEDASCVSEIQFPVLKTA